MIAVMFGMHPVSIAAYPGLFYKGLNANKPRDLGVCYLTRNRAALVRPASQTLLHEHSHSEGSHRAAKALPSVALLTPGVSILERRRRIVGPLLKVKAPYSGLEWQAIV